VTANSCETITRLLAFAESIGVTKAARIDPRLVQVETRLADYCHDPRCPHFGMSLSCPPHVQGPEAMRDLLKNCRHAVVLRIEIDGDSLNGEQRPEVMRLLHEMTASVELEALRLGFTRAYGFAGGSCKASFCHDHQDCIALSGIPCRFPSKARPSMSGYGVNVSELMKACSWSTSLFASQPDNANPEPSWVAGLVLLS
jgi:predicted metal-binding protein